MRHTKHVVPKDMGRKHTGHGDVECIGRGETQDMGHTQHMGPKDVGRKHTGHGT